MAGIPIHPLIENQFDLLNIFCISHHEKNITAGEFQVGCRIGNDLGIAVDGQERDAVLLAHLCSLKRFPAMLGSHPLLETAGQRQSADLLSDGGCRGEQDGGTPLALRCSCQERDQQHHRDGGHILEDEDDEGSISLRRFHFRPVLKVFMTIAVLLSERRNPAKTASLKL